MHCLQITFQEWGFQGYWTIWIKHASRDYVDMIFIAVVIKYQTYSAGNIFIGVQSLSCFQRDCGGSEYARTQFMFVADDCVGRIVHYKWNSICIPRKGIVIGMNSFGKKFDIRQGPAQDVPYYLIIWYVSKVVYLS